MAVALSVFEGYKDATSYATYTPPYYQRQSVAVPTFQAAWVKFLFPVNPVGVGVRIA